MIAYVVLVVCRSPPEDDPAAENDEADFDYYPQEPDQQFSEFPGETSNDPLLLPLSIPLLLPMLLSACFRDAFLRYLLFTLAFFCRLVALAPSQRATAILFV